MASSRSSLRRSILWVHLTCGLVIALYAIILGLTGSILVFREELGALTHSEFHRMQPASRSGIAPDAAIQSARLGLPDWTPISITWPNAASPHWMIYLIRGSEARESYVNAETGKMVGTLDPSGDWLGWLMRMHVNFHAGGTGRIANGYGACALLILCLTGIVLWWPPPHQFASRFRIDFRAEWRRLSWQVHHATGFVALAFIALLAFTGGYYIWMQAYIGVVDRYFERSTDPKIGKRDATTPILSLASLGQIAEDQFPGKPLYRASVPSAPDQSVRITVLEGRPQQFHRVSSVALDPVTGAILQVARLEQRPPGNSILTWFSVVHFGRFGGDGIGFWLAKILWSLLSLSLPLLAVTGTLMWWKRVIEPRLK